MTSYPMDNPDPSIDARCPPELRRGPDAQRKYERDMEPVNRARELLEGKE